MMKNQLMFIILFAGIGVIIEVNTQKWTRIVDNKNYDALKSNYIDSGDIYQHVSEKQQSQNSFGNSDNREINDETFEHDDEELLKLLLDNSLTIDIKQLDLIGDQVISSANVSEETKRVARQVKKQRPGFFWTIIRSAFEAFNETKSAIYQINDIIAANIVPDTTTVKGKRLKTTTPISTTITTNEKNNLNIEIITPTTTITTKKPPYKLTRNTLQNIVRRNLQGLIRLFNIEWKDAINESQISIREFKTALGKSAQPYLKDNPNVFQ